MAKKNAVPAKPIAEQYLDDAITSGRAKLQDIGLAALATPDNRTQVREKTDPDHARKIGRVRDDGQPHTPIILFRDPKTGELRIGDGWHRVHDAFTRRDKSIRAYVIEGDYEDCIWYATCANNHLTLKPMGKDDKKKAAFALFAIDSWWNSSDASIASHIGISNCTIKTLRTNYSLYNNKEIPSVLTMSNGHTRKTSTAQAFRKSSLPKNKKFNALKGCNFLQESSNNKFIKTEVATFRFGSFGNFGVMITSNRLVIPVVINSMSDVLAAIGKLALSRSSLSPSLTPTIVCDKRNVPDSFINMIRCSKIQVMNLEYFFARAKVEQAKGDAAQSPAESAT